VCVCMRERVRACERWVTMTNSDKPQQGWGVTEYMLLSLRI